MKGIILKYLTDTLTDLELEKLLSWLKKPKNLKKFETLLKENYNINMVYDDINEATALQKVKRAIRKKENPVKSLFPNWTKYAIAASIVLLISLTVIFNQDDSQVIEPIIVNNNIEVGTDKATLTLEDGTQVLLEEGKEFQSENIISNGEKIVYKSRETNIKEVVYNYLTIPRGGEFFIKLADGTNVWLNSETQLKYPVSFKDGDTRKVELVYGEAYFDVSHSTEHGGSKFIVYNQSQEIEVLGTQFNIKAYKDEYHVYTTLVEGKVAITSENTRQILKPNEQASLNTNTNMLLVSTIDVYSEISWKDGVFSFRRKPLLDIMKVLSRWYDFDVKFEDESIEKEGFNGVIRKNKNIEDILETIKNFGIIKDYEIINKTVILK